MRLHRRAIMPATEFPLTRAGIAAMLAGLRSALPADVGLVRVGVEAAGHYHQPMIAPGVWPQSWQVVELNPAHVTAQRRVNGSRGVKTDRVDLTAIADLLLAGRGVPVVLGDAPLLELQAWVAHRRRRVEVRTATKNQLIGQLDRPADEAEWMSLRGPRRPEIAAPARKASRATIQHPTLSLVEIVNTYIEMHLLRVLRVWPERWP